MRFPQGIEIGDRFSAEVYKLSKKGATASCTEQIKYTTLP